MTSWNAASSGTEPEVSWARTGTAARPKRTKTIVPYRFNFIGSSSCRGRKRDYNPMGSDFELPRVDPLLLQHGPEVLGQAFLDIGIGQPAVAFLAPAAAPRIADEQGAPGRLATGRVGDGHGVVEAQGHDRVPALDPLAAEGDRDAAGRLGLVDRAVDGKAEHGRVAGGEIGFQLFEDGRPGRAGRVVAEIEQRLVVLGEGIAEGRRLLVEPVLGVRVWPVGFGGHAE